MMGSKELEHSLRARWDQNAAHSLARGVPAAVPTEEEECSILVSADEAQFDGAVRN